MANSPLVSIRIPPETLERIDRLAQKLHPSRRAGRSPNRSQVILDAIDQFLKQHESGDANTPNPNEQNESGDANTPNSEEKINVALQEDHQDIPQINGNLLAEETVSSLMQSPILEPTPNLSDKLLKRFGAWTNFYRASIDYQVALADIQIRSFEELMRELFSFAPALKRSRAFAPECVESSQNQPDIGGNSGYSGSNNKPSAG